LAEKKPSGGNNVKQTKVGRVVGVTGGGRQEPIGQMVRGLGEKREQGVKKGGMTFKNKSQERRPKGLIPKDPVRTWEGPNYTTRTTLILTRGVPSGGGSQRKISAEGGGEEGTEL